MTVFKVLDCSPALYVVTLYEVAPVGPSGVEWSAAERVESVSEDALIWHLWRRSRLERGWPPADRWTRRAAWALWRWRTVALARL